MKLRLRCSEMLRGLVGYTRFGTTILKGQVARRCLPTFRDNQLQGPSRSSLFTEVSGQLFLES
jgi:hypothetical protein